MANYHPLLATLLAPSSDGLATEMEIPPFLRESIEQYKRATREAKRARHATMGAEDPALWATYRQASSNETQAARDLADSLVIALDEDRE